MKPAARERVHVVGRSGVYFVLAVFEEDGYASVVNLSHPTSVQDVPFKDILPLRADAEVDSVDVEVIPQKSADSPR